MLKAVKLLALLVLGGTLMVSQAACADDGSSAATQVQQVLADGTKSSAAEGDDTGCLRSGIDISAGIWAPTISGSFGSNNQQQDVHGVLNLPNNNSPAVDLRARLGRNTFSLSYASLTDSATTTNPTTFSFNNENFIAGDSITGNVAYSSVDLTWEPRLIHSRTAELNAMLLVKVMNLQANIQDNTNGSNATISVSSPVPLVGISGALLLGSNLDFHGRVGYISGSFGNSNNVSFLDYRAGFGYQSEHWGVNVDYRSFNLNGTDSNNNTANLQFGGPSAEINYHW